MEAVHKPIWAVLKCTRWLHNFPEFTRRLWWERHETIRCKSERQKRPCRRPLAIPQCIFALCIPQAPRGHVSNEQEERLVKNIIFSFAKLDDCTVIVMLYAEQETQGENCQETYLNMFRQNQNFVVINLWADSAVYRFAECGSVARFDWELWRSRLIESGAKRIIKIYFGGGFAKR